MKNSFVKTIVIAGITLSPMMLSAQGKGSTETVPGVAGQPQPGGKLGEANDESTKDKGTRANKDWFTKLDADSNGSISREEFAKAGVQRNRDEAMRNRKDREERNATDANRNNKNREEQKATDANRSTTDGDAAKDASSSGSRSDTNRTGTEIKDPAGTSGAPATGTTGTTGATGSSASGSGPSGSATSGTGNRPQ
ncbi:hypothetical protein EI77_02292 [Prosthecobacter fusiformis]|uniref:EF-hand domain-containing protein n=1 Tax=Prosthecobacter fusiformis TaxID=48464 RepID=A0A4R7RZ04_9BACT|nr:hypothetical protein [Prosthecobacter fusiformis]TDU71170.1 hypothetical protein EI77_02292 [Prosthecobacter fusiformis]